MVAESSDCAACVPERWGKRDRHRANWVERAAGPSFEAARLGHQVAGSANLESLQTHTEANRADTEAMRSFSDARATFNLSRGDLQCVGGNLQRVRWHLQSV